MEKGYENELAFVGIRFCQVISASKQTNLYFYCNFN